MNEPRWRVVVAIGDPVPFRTELAARTSAAIRSRDGRAPALVEHRDGDGWHRCPGAECIPDREPSASDRADAREINPGAVRVSAITRRRAGVADVIRRSERRREAQRLASVRRWASRHDPSGS